MPLPITRLRRWFAAIAILMIVTVAGMYFFARWRVRGAVGEVPAKIGLDIQQTAEGFSISKSEQGRTLFTVSASKAVQFKEGGRAELHNVKIVVYGKDASRFDRITSDDFEYDPKTGDVSAQGKVLIDLEANPEGAKESDQTPPAQSRNPIHLETEGLVFNRNTGDATASGRVRFQTPEATGSALGVEYISRAGTMTLRSSVEMAVSKPQQFQLTADRGVISKGPRKVVLRRVHLSRDDRHLQSDQATFFLREDNTVERVLAEGNVEGEFRGRSSVHSRADRAELLVAGKRNELKTATLSGNVRTATEGAESAEANAGRATLHFAANQVLETVHAEDGVHLKQEKPAANGAAGAAESGKGQETAQEIEMTSPVMDFAVKNGRLLELAQTSGPPQIVITQPATGQKTVVTADRFTAKFTDKNRLALLHGEPNARIVSTQSTDARAVDPTVDPKTVNSKVAGSRPAQPDRVSTSPTLDVLFHPDGGISKITQAGGLAYVSGTQRAWAQQGTYTAADQTLVLTGSPRVVDGGMTTTAETIRVNRTSGDAFAEGNVKSTYSDLKAQPEGAMLASSDPIHVVGERMTAHHSPAIAVYSGNARLWQNSNVVEAPTLQFDRDRRSLVAEGHSDQPVKTVLVQVDKGGKATPVTITSPHLTYSDDQRRIFLEGGVTAKGSDATMTARRMSIFLVAHNQVARSQLPGGSRGTQNQEPPTPGNPGQVEKIVADNDVVVAEPNRRATGNQLVYTTVDDKFVLTGGPPSIFDAERGKITGDSLTFFRHDDRVVVEGRETSPSVSRTQVAR